MQQRTFVAALFLPHCPLKAILCHPILLLKPDSLTTDPFSYFGHLVWVIDFKNSGSSDDINGALLGFVLLHGFRQNFSVHFFGLKEKPIEVLRTFCFLLRLDDITFVEISEFSDLRTHSKEI